MGIRLADDVQRLMIACQGLLASPPLEPPGWVTRLPLVGERARTAWQHLSSDTARLMIYVRQYVGPATGYLLVASGYFLKGLAELALSIILAFFLFRDGPAAARRLLLTGERLAGSSGEQLIALAGATIRGVVYGILGTALIQSIIAGLGLAIAGVPGAGFLALLTFFLAVTPIGAAMVWIPAAAWLFVKVGVGWGIFMVVWGLMVSSIDNVVKPMIISQGSEMPFILILLGVLGGAAAFGLIGVFLGPTLLALGLRLLKEWTAARASEELRIPVRAKPGELQRVDTLAGEVNQVGPA
jgi:predicted PurR-regulated permease PerM